MIQVYDTTLRDGSQRKEISLSCEDKLRIAHKLDELGVAFIEGGWPGSNPKDAEFFQRAQHIPWKTALIAAFGATCRANAHPAEDANIRALLEANTPVCTVVGKSSVMHVRDVLVTTLEENLRIIEQSLAYLASQGRRVIYDAEHFFDGYKENPQYALETLQAAVRGGAETLVLCDTNGGSMPWEISDTIAVVKASIDHPLGIHAHNDSEFRRGQLSGGCTRRRHPRTGHDQWLRRTLRQRQPVLAHPQPGAQAWAEMPARRPIGATLRRVALHCRSRQPQPR